MGFQKPCFLGSSCLCGLLLGPQLLQLTLPLPLSDSPPRHPQQQPAGPPSRKLSLPRPTRQGTKTLRIPTAQGSPNKAPPVLGKAQTDLTVTSFYLIPMGSRDLVLAGLGHKIHNKQRFGALIPEQWCIWTLQDIAFQPGA